MNVDIIIVRKSVEDLNWKVNAEEEKFVPGRSFSGGAGKDWYSSKVFPTVDAALQWVEEDKRCFLKENLPYHGTVHRDTHVTPEEFLANPDGWRGTEDYWFNNLKGCDEKFVVRPHVLLELTIRDSKPKNQTAYPPLGMYDGQQVLYYVEAVSVDTETWFGGEMRHCPCHCA